MALKISKHRGLFIFCGVVAWVLFFVLRYLALPEERLGSKLIFIEILDDALNSILVTAVIGLYWYLFAPQNKLNAQVEILQPIEINDVLVSARNETNEWWFNGGRGGYSRTTTLPSLADLAKKKNKTIRVSLIIINPLNASLCTTYASYKKSVRSSKDPKEWTNLKIQRELVATIISAYSYMAQQPTLTVKIYLKNSFSLFRVDLSDNVAVITKEDPIEPAMKYTSGSYFYRAHREDLEHSRKQCEALDERVDFVHIKDVTVENVKGLIAKLTPLTPLNSIFTAADFAEIVKLVKNPVNPYA